MAVGRRVVDHRLDGTATWHDDLVERTYDKPRLAKLGMRPGARVALIGVDDPDLAAELAAFTDDLTEGRRGPGQT